MNFNLFLFLMDCVLGIKSMIFVPNPQLQKFYPIFFRKFYSFIIYIEV